MDVCPYWEMLNKKDEYKKCFNISKAIEDTRWERSDMIDAEVKNNFKGEEKKR